MSDLSADSIRQQQEQANLLIANKQKHSINNSSSNTNIVSSTTTGPTLVQAEEQVVVREPVLGEGIHDTVIRKADDDKQLLNEPAEVIELQKEHEEAPQSILQKAGDTIGSVAVSAKDAAINATETLSHVYTDTLQPAAAVVGEKLSNVAHLAADKVVEAKDALMAPETTEKVSHVVQETKDMIVSAAVVTKETVLESAHVVSDVAEKVYHWVADAVVPQMKDQVEAVTETATNALDTTAGFVATQVGEAKEKAKELISGSEEAVAKESGEKKTVIEEEKDVAIKDAVAKSSGIEAQGEEQINKDASPLINMEVFPKGNIPTTTTRTMIGTTITRESEFGKYLQMHEIIPNVFANFFEDKYHLDLEFGANTFSGLNRELLFAPGQVSMQPNIYLKKQKHVQLPSLSNFLGLAMVDPDFRFKDTGIASKKEFIHWLVVNIPASNITSSFRIPIEQGQELVSFMPSQPDEGTGIHRYLFFLFEYDHKLNFDTFDRILDSNDLQKRADTDFKLERFVNDYKIGSPVGFFMYQCKNENE